jgi:hypothetical protein
VLLVLLATLLLVKIYCCAGALAVNNPRTPISRMIRGCLTKLLIFPPDTYGAVCFHKSPDASDKTRPPETNMIPDHHESYEALKRMREGNAPK